MPWFDNKMYLSFCNANAAEQALITAGTPTKSPTVKKLDYVTLYTGTQLVYQLCIGVWDDDQYTDLNREELAARSK